MKILSLLIVLACYISIYFAPKEELILSVGVFVFIAAYMIMDNNDDNTKKIIDEINKTK